MGNTSLSNAKKKELAKILYLNSQYNQKEIAAEVGTSPQTMTKWVNDEGWEDIKTELTTTNEQQISYLNKQLRLLNEQGLKHLQDDDPATNPDTDGIIKITKAIHYLRTKTSAGQMYETGTEFLKFLAKEDPALAKQVAPLFTAFIRQQL